MSVAAKPALATFAEEHDLVGLTQPCLQAITQGQKGYSVEKAKRFLAFQARIHNELLKHRIVRSDTLVRCRNDHRLGYRVERGRVAGLFVSDRTTRARGYQ